VHGSSGITAKLGNEPLPQQFLEIKPVLIIIHLHHSFSILLWAAAVHGFRKAGSHARIVAQNALVGSDV